MGKRSSFERNPRDYYVTPYEAVLPLLRFVQGGTFIEPCAGNGALIRHLTKNGLTCNYASDIFPEAPGIEQRDVLFFGGSFPAADYVITNPVWKRELLHPMIDKFRSHAPTWLLFDSGWMFTDQAKPYLRFCDKIVSVGRISWMGNGVSSLDDCCWYSFKSYETKTEFINDN